MVKVSRSSINRVITIVMSTDESEEFDRKVSDLLDIIDSYGGSNPYPRYWTTGLGGSVSYSCTTKIGKQDIIEFDQEIKVWKNKYSK